MTDEEFNEEVQHTFVTLLSNAENKELCPGGEGKQVTRENVEEYIKLIVKARLYESEKQMEAVREGVVYIIPEVILKQVTWQVIDYRATGSKDLDLKKL